MAKKLYGTVSEDNFTFVKQKIGLENWDAKLNEILNILRANEEK